MMVYFSTVVRAAPQARGGEIVKLDWDSKRVLARAPIVPTNPKVDDPNPRGSTRGGRGILLDGDDVFVASYHSILVFDRDLKPKRQLSHPLFVGLHELSWDGDNIWATSTSIDAAIKVTRFGAYVDSWWPREDPLLAKRYHFTPLAIDKSQDHRTSFVDVANTAPNHVHLNAVAMWDGRPLMLLNKFGCVIKLHPTEIVFEDPQLQGCHNVLVTNDGSIVINNTLGRTVHVYSATGHRSTQIHLVNYPFVRQILRRYTLAKIGAWLAKHGRPARWFHPIFGRFAVARPIFVRGLCQTWRKSILVGISPATILEVDWQTGELLDMYSYSDDRHVCIHGLVSEEARA